MSPTRHDDCPFDEKFDEISSRLTGVEVLCASMSKSVEQLVELGKRNDATLHGNGAPGLKVDVALLRDQMGEVRDGNKWLWRTAITSLLLPVLLAAIYAVARHIGG